MIVNVKTKALSAEIHLTSGLEVDILVKFLSRFSRKEIAHVMGLTQDDPTISEISDLVDKLYDGLTESDE